MGDGPSPDVRTDPARPGLAWQRMWVTDSAPAKIVYETLHLPQALVPPANCSVLSVATSQPDAAWKGKVGRAEVKAFFAAMGAPGASTYSPQAPHPFMQKTRTLDFCCVLEAEITLVLDTHEVQLKAGEILNDLKLADGVLQGPNGDQVAIVNVAYIVRTQCDKSLGSARGRDELNFEIIRIVDFDNRAQITDAKACLWHITLEHNCIE